MSKSRYDVIKDKIKNSGVSLSNNDKHEGSNRYATLKNRIKSEGTKYDINEDYINSYIKDSQAFYSGAQSDYEKSGYYTSSSNYKAYQKKYWDLNQRREYIETYLNYRNKESRFDKDKDFKNLYNFIAEDGHNMESVLSSFDSKSKFYSQFKTKDDYKDYINNPEEYEYSKAAKNDKEYSSYVEKGRNMPDNQVQFTREHPVRAFLDYIDVFDLADSQHLYDADPSYWSLSEDEANVYYYYLGKYGGKKAQEYLNYAQGKANTRFARKLYDLFDDSTATKLTFGAIAGVEQFGTGVKNLFSDDDHFETSAVQLASQMVREDFKDTGPEFLGSSLGQIGYDLVTTTANMLPSILVSAVAPEYGAILGAATIGGSSAGNAYAEMMNLGYDKGQARLYSTLVGISEAGLQYALGGIGDLGGKLSGNIVNKATTKLASNLDSAIGKIAVKYGSKFAGNMFSEGIEESLQEIIEPTLKSLITGDKKYLDDVTLEQVLYSGVLGSLSAGMFEGKNAALEVANDIKGSKIVGKAMETEGFTDKLVTLGKTFSADTVAYKIASKVNENTTSYEILELLNSVDATLSEQNYNDIVESLVEQGVPKKVAKQTANKVNECLVSTGDIDKNLADSLAINEPLRQALYDEIINPNATTYQKITGRTSDAKSVFETVADVASKKRSQNAKISSTDKQIDNTNALGDNSIPESENASDGNLNAHNNVLSSNAHIAEFTEVKDENGKTAKREAKIQLEDGSVESVDNIKLSEDDAAYISIATELGYDAETANSIIDFAKANNIAPDMMVDLNLEYQMGYANVGKNYLSSASKNFTKEQIKGIREIGKNARDNKSNKNKPSVKEGGGKIIDDTESGLNKKSLSKRQKSSVKVAEKLSSVVGGNMHIFESTEKDGKHILTKDLVDSEGNIVKKKGEVAPNGFFDAKSGDIYIDLNSGNFGEGVIMYTLAHEYVHFIRSISSKAFNKLADIVVKELADNGTNIEALIQNQIDKAKRNGRDISFDEAYEEFVADSLETQLTSEDTAYYLNKIYNTDKNLFKHLVNKLKEFYKAFKDMVNEYRDLDYTHRTSESAEMERLSRESLKKISAVYAEALKVAAGEYQGVTLEKKTAQTDSSGVKYSYGGRNAKTANLTALKEAESLLEKGTDSETVRKKTGWFKGYDGLWRFEIDDSKMAIDGADKKYLIQNGTTLLEYLVHHEALFEAYPELKNVIVKVEKLHGKGDGYYSPAKNIIGLDLYTVKTASDKALKEILIHEIQHIIQKTEGFTNGANTDNFNRYLKTAGEVEAYDVSDRVDYTAEQRKNTRPDIDRTDVVFAEDKISFHAADENKDLLNLISKVKSGDFKAKEKVYFDNISDDVADRITDITNIDVKGFKIAIEARQIEHILKDHGANGKTDHSMANDTDISKIEYVLKNADNIDLSGKTQAYTHMENGRNKTSDTVKYEKYIGDKSYYVVQAVADTKAKTLFIVTAYIGIPTQKKETSQLIDTQSPDATPKSGSVIVSKNSIPNNFENVNNNSLQNPENDTKTDKKTDGSFSMRNPVEETKDLINKYPHLNLEQDISEVDGVPAIELSDGSVIPIPHDIGRYPTHVSFIEANRIDVDDLKSGGWIGNGVYESSFTSDTQRYIEQKQAQKIVAEIKGEKFEQFNDTVKYSNRDYSYNALISKPDMKVTTVDTKKVPETRADIVSMAKKNAAKVGEINIKDGSVSVLVEDIGRNVILAKKGLVHGLDRRLKEFAPYTVKAGEIIKNSIKINELTPKDANAEQSYILIGSAKNSSGTLSVVRSVINKYSNELSSMDVLYALNAKKGTAVLNAPRDSTPDYRSKISISDLLDYVNKYFPEVLPEEVLKHYGHTSRPSSNLSDDVLFSERDSKISSTTKALQAENDVLKKDNANLKELLSLQKELTHGKLFTRPSVEKIAASLRGTFKSFSSNKEALVKELNRIYSYIAAGKDVTIESIYDEAENAANMIVKGIKYEETLTEEAENVLNYIKGTRVYVNDTIKSEIEYRYGSFNNFRKSLFGRVIFTNKDKSAISLDSWWQEASNRYPSIFEADTNTNDMPSELAGIIDRMKSSTSYDREQYEYESEMLKQDIKNQIYDSYWEATTLQTVADRYQRKIELLKSEQNQKKADALQASAERYQGKIDELKSKHKQQMSDVREFHHEKERNLVLEAREKRKQAIDKTKESIAKRTEKDKLQKQVTDTIQWLSHPTKTQMPCPDVLKAPFADFLKSIDFSSKRKLEGKGDTQNDVRMSDKLDTLTRTVDKILKGQSSEDDSSNSIIPDAGYLDLPVDFVEELQSLSESFKQVTDSIDSEYIVNQLTSSEVKKLNSLIRTLKKSATEMSQLYNNMRFAKVEEIGRSTIEHADSLGEAKANNKIWDFIKWDNATPYTAFRRFGEAGKSLFTEFQDAQDKLAFLAKEIFDFKDATYTDKEVRQWSEDVHTIELPNGNRIKLTTADAMSIYCLAKRQQAIGHLFGGGIRIIGTTNKVTKKKAPDSRSMLNVDDVQKIVGSLTDRQKQVADSIQKFMSSTCAEWGNEISMKRFLAKMFTEENYFPIESNDEVMNDKDPSFKKNDMFRLLNISASKPLTEGANNEIVIRNIFEIFANHSSDMARMNSFAMPLLDFMKWINYREKTVNDETGQIDVVGVRKSLNKAFGDNGVAVKYIRQFIKDVNGTESSKENSFAMSMAKKAKVAAVAANLRVAALQPTAFPRARVVLSDKALLYALRKKPQVKKAKQYCGIALWKSFGFYDTDISKNVEAQIKGGEGVISKIVEKSLAGAELGDSLTWGALWNACEYDVRKNTDIKFGTEEFNKAVGLKLREVVYASQVVDSTLTRSQFIRNRSGLSQMITAFMSEPTISYNSLMDAAWQTSEQKRITGSMKTALSKTGKVLTRAISTYMITQAFAALAEGLFDAYRDDDDEEFLEKFKKEFVDNLIQDMSVVGKIPILKDGINLLQKFLGIGFLSTDRLDTQYLTAISDAVEIWADIANKGDDSKYTVYAGINKTAKALSQFTGLPISNALREVTALWNNTFGDADNTVKIRSYKVSGEGERKELFDAIKSNNTEAIARLEKQIGGEKEYQNALNTMFRENESRIWQASEARASGDLNTYKNMVQQLVSEYGSQYRDNIIKAINNDMSNAKTLAKEAKIAQTEGNTKAHDEAIKTLLSKYSEGYVQTLVGEADISADDPKYTKMYKTEEFGAALSNDDTVMADDIRDELIKASVADGKTQAEAEESFLSTAKNQIKKGIQNGSISPDKAADYLNDYCDVDDAELQADFWDFQAKNPELKYDWSKKTYQYYVDEIEPYSIYVDTYDSYLEQKKECSGKDANRDGKTDAGSKKAEVMAVINSLPLSRSQKDALYYQNGWASSKIHEAPWH